MFMLNKKRGIIADSKAVMLQLRVQPGEGRDIATSWVEVELVGLTGLLTHHPATMLLPFPLPFFSYLITLSAPTCR